MEPSTNSDQMCYLCKDPCSSLADLKQHIKVVHNLKKSEADVFVKLSVEEKLRSKEEANLDEKVVDYDEEEELTEELKVFLEAEVKSSFDFLFKDLFDVLNGKIVPNFPEEELDEDFSVSDIRDAFQRLGDEIQNVEIPESLIIPSNKTLSPKNRREKILNKSRIQIQRKIRIQTLSESRKESKEMKEKDSKSQRGVEQKQGCCRSLQTTAAGLVRGVKQKQGCYRSLRTTAAGPVAKDHRPGNQ